MKKIKHVKYSLVKRPVLVRLGHILCCTNNRSYMLFVYVMVKPYNITCIIQVDKSTPLHWAAGGGHTNIVSLLVDHGAGVDMKSRVS